MKISFVKVHSKLPYLDKLKPSKKFCLVTTEQYEEQAKKFPYHAIVLGCDISSARKFERKVEKFLCTDRFHSLQLALSVRKAVFYYEENISRFVEKMKKKRKAALIKLLSQSRIGIIASIKPGQFQLRKAEKLRAKLEKKGKKTFIFLTDYVTPADVENFSCSFVNTACPGLALDMPVVNSDELEEFL